MSDKKKEWTLQIDGTEDQLNEMLNCPIININGNPYWSKPRVGLLLIKFASQQIEKQNDDIWRTRHFATELMKELVDRKMMNEHQIGEVARAIIELMPSILTKYDKANKTIINEPTLDDFKPQP